MDIVSSQSSSSTPGDRDLELSPGTRLLHIGPFKTGTTALQGAFCQSRDELAKHGVIYPAGALQHWRSPTLALTGRRNVRGRPPPERRHWQQLVDAFEQAGDAMVLHSSEAFTECDEQAIRRAVRELGGGHPVHIGITVRPLLKILPSQWQMHIRGGWIHTPYDTWLRQIFDNVPIEPGDPTERFWHRHDHAQLAARWADIVGPDNVTVIVADPHNRYALLRPFEVMLGIPTGTLEFEPTHLNESLPPSTIELLRRINREYNERGWSDAEYYRLIRTGGTTRLRNGQQRRPPERPIPTPPWARERAIRVGNRIADDLGELGVRIAGDLDNLRCASDHPTGPDRVSNRSGRPTVAEAPSDELVPVAAAVLFTSGIIERQQRRTARLRESVAQARANTEQAKRELARVRQGRGTDTNPDVGRGATPPRIEHRRVVDVNTAILVRLLLRRGIRRICGFSKQSRDTQRRSGPLRSPPAGSR